jgi:parallel beta-helix repeat protein
MGGSGPLAGTDGIDIWYSSNINVHENTVTSVGGDGISFAGSVASPDTAISCQNNILNTVGGSIKVHGSVSTGDISYNTCSNCANGGVTILVDSVDVESGTISGINIHDNNIASCGGAGEAGGITVEATGGAFTQTVTGITIDNNNIATSPMGVSVFSISSIEMFSNLTITNNLVSTCSTGILVGAANNTLTLTGNTVLNSTAEGIAIPSSVDGLIGMGAGTFLIENNTINNFMSSGTGYAVLPAGIAIGSGSSAAYTISGNTISDPQVTTPAYYAIYSLIGLTGSALSQNNTGIDLTTTKGVSAAGPAIPAGLTAAAGNGQVTLSWSVSLAATGYNLKRSLVSGSNYTVIASNIAATGYTDTAVTNDATYYYVVSGSNGYGASGNSAQVSARPAAPITVAESGTPSISGSSTGVQLTVTQSVIGHTYQLQYTNSLVPTPATWSNIGTPVAGTGGIVVLTDATGYPAYKQRFYRIWIQQ